MVVEPLLPVRTECGAVSALLSDWVDGELTPEQSALLEAHLVKCPACTMQGRSLQKVVAALRAQGRAATGVGPELAARLRLRLERSLPLRPQQ